ncbi:ribonucleotide reductase N-terminal alpha domain-containing protein [Rickettsiales bacterium LUAb2]
MTKFLDKGLKLMKEYNNIKIHTKDPEYLTEFSNKLLEDFYLRDNENFCESIARAAVAFCYQDYELAQNIYNYAYNGWFMFASPILSNAPQGTWKVGNELKNKAMWAEDKVEERRSLWLGEEPFAMPISCYALYVPDTIVGQIASSSELAALSVMGGGVGLHNGIRTTSKKAPGPIPYMKTIDAIIGYYKQSQVRRGACAYYMDVDHPDVFEHLRFRVPSGGDHARKSDNRKQFHNAINITDKFIDAVVNDTDFDLVCPHSKEVKQTIKARQLWEEILEIRALTGEPYLFKIDEANRQMPASQKALGLRINGSNICSEISLPTNEERTFVCCLSSLNLEKYDEWKDTNLVQDLVRYLDNVTQFFIDFGKEKVLDKAKFSAKSERALGIGTMGWANYLQKNMIPFEGGGVNSSIQLTHQIFSKIKEKAVVESKILATERGEPNDMKDTGLRNSRLLAIAPNSNNAIILNTSLGIEPLSGNSYSHSTRAGTFLVKNKYLDDLLRAKNVDIEETWKSIIQHNGSIQHLDFFTDHEKKVFKTAFEIDQHWVIEQANARQNYICQTQSLNLFFVAGVDRSYFNSVHLKALKADKLVSVYYCRMNRELKADIVKEIQNVNLEMWNSEEECVACSG